MEERKGQSPEFLPRQSLVYEREQVTVAMGRWRLHLLCDELLKGQPRHTFDEAWPWLGAFLAFLLALLPREEFKDFLGLKASTWEAIIVIGMFATGLMFLRLVWFAIRDLSQKPPTAEQVVDRLMEEMTRVSDGSGGD